MPQRLASAALVAALFAFPLLLTGCGGSPDPESCTPVAESCNGVDDDCDGEIDEAGATGCTFYYSDADSDGFGGASACLCAPAAPFTITTGGDCDDTAPAIHPGAAELCNGIDDDCDTVVDEGIAGCCTPLEVQGCGIAQGSCTVGTSTCGGDFVWGPCLDGVGSPVLLPGAQAELCDALDNDCDGSVDEDFPALGSGCSAGVGACAAVGTMVCTGDGTGVQCDALPGAPTAEACDGIDNDCDGVIDELGGSIGALDLCNGQDDDCNPSTPDGSGDPLVTAACCPTGNLADCTNSGGGTRCQTGAGLCASGMILCAGAVERSAETCNGVDDDCDGLVDDVPGLGASCTGGGLNTTGACTAAYSCDGTPGPGPSGLTCVQVVGPTSESCNGYDDDCDGITDEDAAGDPLAQVCYYGPPGTEGVGSCQAGVQTCDFAAWGGCTGMVVPNSESCNGLDDDCDGVVDDGVTDAWFGQPCCPTGNLADCANTGGATRCHAGTGQCLGGGEFCAGAVMRNVEICNSVDDDCDGIVDVDTPFNGTPCGVSVGICASAYACDGLPGPGPYGLTCTQTVGPQVELCNGLDDDCDGSTDENWPLVGTICNVGVGACARSGFWECRADGIGQQCSVTAGTAVFEICANGIDDDCNGVTDEAGCI